MRKYLLILTVLLVCGCGTKPRDVPELYPCRVIVMNGSTPITGAGVILGLTSESSSCAMSGITDSSGVAVIFTKRLAWQGSGVPAGEYIVTLAKSPKPEGGLSLEEFQKLEPMEQDRYNAEQARKLDALPREIPIKLADFATSPYRMTVSKEGENRLEIDIADAKPPKK